MTARSHSVLLIDDDQATNVYNSAIVRQAAVVDHVHVCTSGKSALEFLRSAENPQPSVIFLDVNMPSMNGWEFLEDYHRLSEQQRAKVVVIMLTTSLDPNDELKAKEMGTQGFIRKPLTSEEVVAIFNKHFPDHS